MPSFQQLPSRAGGCTDVHISINHMILLKAFFELGRFPRRSASCRSAHASCREFHGEFHPAMPFASLEPPRAEACATRGGAQAARLKPPRHRGEETPLEDPFWKKGLFFQPGHKYHGFCQGCFGLTSVHDPVLGSQSLLEG